MADFQALGGTLSALTHTLNATQNIARAAKLFGDSGAQNAAAAKAESLQKLRARQQLEEKIAADKSAQDTAILNAQKAEDERRRLSALRSAVARRRAVYGAAGSGSEGGSAEAVLLGLVNESNQEGAATNAVYDLRRQVLDQHLSSLKARNLLELSQAAQ